MRSTPASSPYVPILLVAAVALAASSGVGCSKRSILGDVGEEDAGGEGEEDAGVTVADASRSDASDAAAARDARTDQELAELAAAGRLCGERDQPPCPLQAWMKRNATTMIGFGETTTLAEVFDQVALLTPPAALWGGGKSFPNWESIARDGAAASRIGNIPAAKAACRECHIQYRRGYHEAFRGLALRPLPPLGQPPPDAGEKR
jgi:hypothetical protein